MTSTDASGASTAPASGGITVDVGAKSLVALRTHFAREGSLAHFHPHLRERPPGGHCSHIVLAFRCIAHAPGTGRRGATRAFGANCDSQAVRWWYWRRFAAHGRFHRALSSTFAPATKPNRVGALSPLQITFMASSSASAGAASALPAVTAEFIATAGTAFGGGDTARTHTAALAAAIACGTLIVTSDGLVRLAATSYGQGGLNSDGDDEAAAAAAPQPGDFVGLVDPTALAAALGPAAVAYIDESAAITDEDVAAADAAGIRGRVMLPTSPLPSLIPAAALGLAMIANMAPPRVLQARVIADIASMATQLAATKAAIEAAGDTLPMREATEIKLGLGAIIKPSRAIGALAGATAASSLRIKAEVLCSLDFEMPLKAIAMLVCPAGSGYYGGSAGAGAGATAATAGATAATAASLPQPLRLQLAAAAVMLARLEAAAKLVIGEFSGAVCTLNETATAIVDTALAALAATNEGADQRKWSWLHEALVDATTATAVACAVAEASDGSMTLAAVADEALLTAGLPVWLHADGIDDTASVAAASALIARDAGVAGGVEGAAAASEAVGTATNVSTVLGDKDGSEAGAVAASHQAAVYNAEKSAMAAAMYAALAEAPTSDALYRIALQLETHAGCAPLHDARSRLLLAGGGPKGVSKAVAAAGLASLHAHARLTRWADATDRKSVARRLTALEALGADAAVVRRHQVLVGGKAKGG